MVDIGCVSDYVYDVEVGVNEVSFDLPFKASSEESELMAECGSFHNYVVRLEKDVVHHDDKFNQLKLKIVTELLGIPSSLSLDTDVIEEYYYLVSIAPTCALCKKKVLFALDNFSKSILCLSCQSENDEEY